MAGESVTHQGQGSTTKLKVVTRPASIFALHGSAIKKARERRLLREARQSEPYRMLRRIYRVAADDEAV